VKVVGEIYNSMGEEEKVMVGVESDNSMGV